MDTIGCHTQTSVAGRMRPLNRSRTGSVVQPLVFGSDSAVEVDHVSENDRHGEKSQPRGTVMLLFKASLAATARS